MSTLIEWTDETWNPVRGCSRVSEGCRHCYAERQAARNLPGNRSPTEPTASFAIYTEFGPRWTGKVELIESKLQEPLHWKKPRRVFVNSMSDLFHENLAYPDILHVFQTMAKCLRHTFQILTKRPGKMSELLSLCWWRNLGYSPAMGGDHWVKVIAGEQRPGDQNYLPNVWLGVSVEDQANKDRIDILRQTPAAIRFLSIEPLLEDIGELDLTGIHWVIVGGESGPGERPLDVSWVRSVRDQCKAAKVPLFVKQLGARPGYRRKSGWHDIDLDDSKGGNWDEWDADLRIREFPE